MSNRTSLNHINAFLTATAVLEGITGILLLTIPSVLVSFLLGTTINEPEGLSGIAPNDPGSILARLTGVALISLSIICWSYRGDTQNISSIIKSLLFYNFFAGALLIYSYTIGLSGIGLWPAVILHFVFGIWCIQLLMKKPKVVTP